METSASLELAKHSLLLFGSTRRACRYVGWHESPLRGDYRLGELHRNPDDDNKSGDQHQVACEILGLMVET
jgi:hypothetical protein